LNVPAQTFEFSDYHRTIIGYHGTTVTAAERLVSGERFLASDRDNEWFGRGVYFWEYAPKQAWWWAREHKANDRPAVVGAIIRLGNCFDLLDPRNVPTLRAFKDELVEKLTAIGAEIPRNVRQDRALDCAVFNYIYGLSDETPKPIETARGVYVPTGNAKRVWRGSWISEEAHIQICVREPKNILAVWHVRADGSQGRPEAQPS
jgi:hypothetical protein